MTFDGDVHSSQPKRRLYTPLDVSFHQTAGDAWVSLHARVIDLTSIIASSQSSAVVPLIKAAGSDISHWFVLDAQGEPVPKTIMNRPGSYKPEAFAPLGKYIHLPGYDEVEVGWWRDPDLIVGRLASAVQKVSIENMLTGQRAVLSVPVEESLHEIERRYLTFNAHGGSYTFKRLGKVLNMDKTLTENGIPNDKETIERTGLNADSYVSIIQAYFNDDLTEA